MAAENSPSLKRILQSELDQAGWDYGLRDLAEVHRGAEQVSTTGAGRDGEHRVVEEIEEVGPELDLVSLSDLEVLHDREVHILLEWTAVDIAHPWGAEAIREGISGEGNR